MSVAITCTSRLECDSDGAFCITGDHTCIWSRLDGRCVAVRLAYVAVLLYHLLLARRPRSNAVCFVLNARRRVMLDGTRLRARVLLDVLRLRTAPAEPREPAGLRLAGLLLRRALGVGVCALRTALGVVVGALGTAFRLVVRALGLALEVLGRAGDLAVRPLGLGPSANVLLVRSRLRAVDGGRSRVLRVRILVRCGVGGLRRVLLGVGVLLLSGALGLADVVASVGRLGLSTDTCISELLVAGGLCRRQPGVSSVDVDMERTRSSLSFSSPTALACCA